MEKKRTKSGWIGLLMLIVGANLFFSSTNSGYMPLWIAWLVGPILWYGGFLFVCFFFLNRIFAPMAAKAATEKQRGNVVETAEKGMSAKAGSLQSHLELVRPGVSYRKLALMGATLGLLITLATTVRAADTAAEGQSLFKAKCAMCHGPEADGKTAMGTKFGIRDMHSADVQKQSDAELKEIITKGKGKMPSYDGKMNSEQVTQVVSYIRQLGKK